MLPRRRRARGGSECGPRQLFGIAVIVVAGHDMRLSVIAIFGNAGTGIRLEAEIYSRARHISVTIPSTAFSKSD